MFKKTLSYFALAVAGIWFVAFVMAWVSPVSYLKSQSKIGIAPVSISWALQRANEDLMSGAYENCDNPVFSLGTVVSAEAPFCQMN